LTSQKQSKETENRVTRKYSYLSRLYKQCSLDAYLFVKDVTGSFGRQRDYDDGVFVVKKKACNTLLESVCLGVAKLLVGVILVPKF